MAYPQSGQPSGAAPTPFDEDFGQPERTLPAAEFRTYSYRENLFAEFDHLVSEGRQFDGLIIDLMQVGYTLAMQVLVRFAAYAQRLLKSEGVLLFIKGDGAVTLSKGDPSGALSFTVYDSPFGIFARYPLLADYVCATVSGIDRRRLRGGGNSLANHILSTSTPVLTGSGIVAKASCLMPPPLNWVLQLVDDYSTVEAICRSLERQYKVPQDEAYRLLQELEASKLIFPIFTRIQFLSSCYHYRKPFRLGRYMVAAGILTDGQLEELLELQQEEGWGRKQKVYLGLLAIRHGYLNTRELEVLLNDQYLYGGSKKADEKRLHGNLEVVKNSMIGSLAAIDAGGLLQSLEQGKKTGLLTVEDRDRSFMVAFENGKPSHARLNKLCGYEAMIEFLVSWSEGIFVFKDRRASAELDEQCRFTQPLHRILMDGALYQDQTNQILGQIPGGKSAIIERVWNFEAVWQELTNGPLTFFEGTAVDKKGQRNIEELSMLVDGMTMVDELVRTFDTWPVHMVMKAIKLLLDNSLVRVQKASLFKPLSLFQRLTADLEAVVGAKENHALLTSSLYQVHGNSAVAQCFSIDPEGRVGVNMGQLKKSGASVSSLLIDLRRWMEAYLAYCRRIVDPAIVNQIAAAVGSFSERA